MLKKGKKNFERNEDRATVFLKWTDFSHNFQSKWIDFRAKKREKQLYKVGGSHDFQSNRINLGAKKGKQFGQSKGVVMTFKVSEST